MINLQKYSIKLLADRGMTQANLTNQLTHNLKGAHMSRLDCLQTVFSALISPVSTMASVWGGALGWLYLLCR